MSYVISESQQLASAENYVESKQFDFDVKGMEITSHSVGFGQPLYTFLSKITSYKCIDVDGGIIPILPYCGVTLTFIERSEDEYGVYVCGPSREIKKIEVENSNSVLLMQFVPGTATSLLLRPIGELTDTSALASLTIRGGQQIGAGFAKPMEMDMKVKQISAVLRTHLLRNPSNALISRCIREICETDGVIKAEELAEQLDVTTRYIGKLFETHVGLSPKYCAGVVKLKEALRKVIYNRQELLTSIAAECGYFDHTHMNKYFRKMLHCSSGEIRKNNFDMVDYDRVKSFIG